MRRQQAERVRRGRAARFRAALIGTGSRDDGYGGGVVRADGGGDAAEPQFPFRRAGLGRRGRAAEQVYAMICPDHLVNAGVILPDHDRS
ncbi:hypothetical protein KIF24_05820 [Micromonospora sp. Llam7]|uniref:hypothetical protein n=1 Tax=Micromonospora tarapacensis TaxID=2835305 RepID=UPI001C83F456|nr:hypothetical protein [Micromonospora tarapacensis]MBX7265607.1 hypothetical protein [Micromonospora tarapacensis]